MVREPKKTFEDLCRFLEIDYDEELLRQELSNHHERRGWYELTAKQRDEIWEEVGWFYRGYKYTKNGFEKAVLS